MKERIDKILRKPAVAHILAANDRYNRRLGPQFAAAVTYFSVLSMVPILMFGVSMLGMTLTVLRPDWLELVQESITAELGDNSMAKSIKEVIDHAFANWQGIGLVALLTAAYSGTNWVGNLKKAFRVMWRDRFSDASVGKNLLVEIIENFFIFLALLVIMAVAFGMTSAGSSFSHVVIEWLGLAQVPGIGVFFRIVTIALVLAASWLLFSFLFIVLPGQGTKVRTWLVGTFSGAVLVTALQQVASLVIGIFSGNAAASIFGPVIVVMLMFNILATIIMMVAAWVGTADTWQQEQARHDAEKVAGVKRRDEVEVEGEDDSEEVLPSPEPDTPKSWADKRRRERWAARKPLEQLRVANYDPEAPPEQEPAPDVPPDIAARSVKVGMGVGWGVGAATGIGLGAALAALVAKITGR